MLVSESDLVQQRKCIGSRGLRMIDKTDGCRRTESRPYQFRCLEQLQRRLLYL